jgi:hypothetical protein
MSCADPYFGRTGAPLPCAWAPYKYVNPPAKAVISATRPVLQPRPADEPAVELWQRIGTVVGSLRGIVQPDQDRRGLGKPRPMDPRRPAQAWDARHENTDAVAMGFGEEEEIFKGARSPCGPPSPFKRLNAVWSAGTEPPGDRGELGALARSQPGET